MHCHDCPLIDTPGEKRVGCCSLQVRKAAEEYRANMRWLTDHLHQRQKSGPNRAQRRRAAALERRG